MWLFFNQKIMKRYLITLSLFVITSACSQIPSVDIKTIDGRIINTSEFEKWQQSNNYELLGHMVQTL